MSVIYLSGCIRPAMPPFLGVMLEAYDRHRIDLTARIWAADNGCFTAGEGFQYDRFRAWLSGYLAVRETCLFVTAPDVLGDAAATLHRSREPLSDLRSLGFRTALVAQDGLTPTATPWGTFDVLFIGGSTRWKLSEAVRELVAQARGRGVWVHMGRVNSYRRLRLADHWGVGSVDGTYLAFRARRNGHGQARGPAEVERWLALVEAQPCLPIAV